MKKDFAVVLYFFPGNGYEIRVRIGGFGTRCAATLFSQKPWDLARSGRNFQLRNDIYLPIPKRELKLLKLRTATRRTQRHGEKILIEDRDYESLDLPLRAWDRRLSLRFGILGVAFSRVTNSAKNSTRKRELRALSALRAQSTSIGVTS